MKAQEPSPLDVLNPYPMTQRTLDLAETDMKMIRAWSVVIGCNLVVTRGNCMDSSDES